MGKPNTSGTPSTEVVVLICAMPVAATLAQVNAGPDSDEFPLVIGTRASVTELFMSISVWNVKSLASPP